MKIVLFEDRHYLDLLPLVYFRPVWELRCGARTLQEKFEAQLQERCYFLARKYLCDFYLENSRCFDALPAEEDILLVNGRWLAGTEEAAALQRLEAGAALLSGATLLAWRVGAGAVKRFVSEEGLDSRAIVETDSISPESRREFPNARLIEYPWDALSRNGEEIARDYRRLAEPGKIAGTVWEGAHILSRENVTVESGAVIKPGVVIDAENGPVWIDAGALVMPNAVLEGPLYVGKQSRIKIGAKIYENTSIGPVCKIGGEVEECIVQGYSNKQHDGFLGHAYLGAWVNLGADTNNSDLKNNYGVIQVLLNGKPVNTGKRFVGLMMGDHSKCAINTMFNTGSVVGASCNIFGAGMPPKFVPSFSWGGAEGMEVFDFDKAVELAEIVFSRRNAPFTERDRALFRAVWTLAKRVEAGSLL